MAERTILLTGAAGRIGRAVVQGLSDEPGLYLTDIIPGEEAQARLGDICGERYHQANLASREEVGRLFASLLPIDAIVHLAASWRDSDDILRNMIRATTVLMEVAIEQGLSRYVYASSSAVTEFHELARPEAGHPAYWERSSPPTIDESTDLRAPNLYGVAKIWTEYHARFLHDVHGIRTIGLRIGNFTTREGFDDLGECPRRRALLDCDAVQLVRLALDTEAVECEVFNAISWPPETPGVWLDVSKAQEMLGYRPSLGRDHGQR
ncbi:MAG: NAD(P)-dependent oxidoreductase [Armatimonadota bacterium]|nr:NAD(P)-dependent oxidoreductase [Armatimonadota bacterium]